MTEANEAGFLKSSILLQSQRPRTAIQYKINARKAIAGKPHVGALLAPTGVNSSTVVPESNAEMHRDPNKVIATVTFGANAYSCSENEGQIRLQVICERSVLGHIGPHTEY
jgi:hypothetical protein